MNNLSQTFKTTSMLKKLTLLVMIISTMIVLYSCNGNEITDPNPDAQTTMPSIDSIIATKYVIEFGGSDPTTIAVYAKGGNLTYNWEVDLGDIVPQNADASIIMFTGSPCCIGEKEIKCTVANDKGNVSEIIKINISK